MELPSKALITSVRVGIASDVVMTQLQNVFLDVKLSLVDPILARDGHDRVITYI